MQEKKIYITQYFSLSRDFFVDVCAPESNENFKIFPWSLGT